MKIKRICAWCNRDMGWAIWENFDESLPRITHSICDECSTKVLNDLNRTEGKNQENKSQLTIERRS
jgi:hypothetical protein